MNTPIFPKEILDFTSIIQMQKHSVKSQLIFTSVVLFIVVACVALPFIHVPVNVQSGGILRPASTVTTLRAPINGIIADIYVENNTSVKRGTPILALSTELPDNKLKHITEQITLTHGWIRDINLLITTVSHSAFIKITNLQTPLYRQDYAAFYQKVLEGNTAYLKTKKIFERQKKLYREEVIAQTEYEESNYQLNKASNDFNLMKQTHINQWQAQLDNYKKELAKLKQEQSLLQEEKERYAIKAPLSGTLQGLEGTYAGSAIFTNQEIATISPDSSLIVETYVSPSDIGLIHEQMAARFQIDAFNYNQWGLATGGIIEISNDILLHDNQPVFKVKCSIDQKYLSLKNGYKGHLKKGMTLQVRFSITERTLWQLLYDKMDDWLNPSIGG